MSRTVYRTVRAMCTRCEEEQLVDLTAIDNSRWDDPKIRHTEDESDEWNKNVHCDCGNCLSPQASRYGHYGFEVLDRVERVTADQLDDGDADLGSLF